MDDSKLSNFFILSTDSKMIIEKVNNFSPKICCPLLGNNAQTHNYSIPVEMPDAQHPTLIIGNSIQSSISYHMINQMLFQLLKN